jgi:hypothetical protein
VQSAGRKLSAVAPLGNVIFPKQSNTTRMEMVLMETAIAPAQPATVDPSATRL